MSVIVKKTVFKRNTSKKYTRLTDLANEFKLSPSSKGFTEISKLTSQLVYNTLMSYQMLDEDPSTVEDIREDCKTLVLLKALNSFDNTRGASFCTHYCWQLRSFVQYKRRDYYKRSKIRKAISIDCAISEGDNKRTLAEVVSNSSPAFMHRVKNEYNKWIGEGRRYVNYTAFKESYNNNPGLYDNAQQKTEGVYV